MTSRRRFIQIAPAAGPALWAAGAATAAHAQALLVGERDAQAVKLGYVADAARADRARYRQYAPGQACMNCALYQGRPADSSGGCPLFGTRQVAARGWCSAWAKRT